MRRFPCDHPPFPLGACVAGFRVDCPGPSARLRVVELPVGIRAVSPPRQHVGTWNGPGVLALLDGQWVHYLLRDAPRDLRETAAALVGTDAPTITITLAEDGGNE